MSQMYYANNNIFADSSLTEWQTAAVEYPACDELIVEAKPLDRNINSILYLQNIEVRKWYFIILNILWDPHIREPSDSLSCNVEGDFVYIFKQHKVWKA